MTNQQILEKAITKAIDGGYDPEPFFKTLDFDVHAIVDNPLQYALIFNHDFAKALWGEEDYATGSYFNGSPDYFYNADDLVEEIIPMWQYHLQQMVISEDPIKYLGENI